MLIGILGIIEGILFKILAEEYKPDNATNNYLYYKMETLNKEGIKELYEIHKETHRKVQRLMEKKEYKGDYTDILCWVF